MTRWHKCIVLILLFLLTSLGTEARVFLVSVGIADYPGTANDLSLPAKDARTITWLYSKNTGMKYVQLLNSEATRNRIIAAMNKVFPMAGEKDIVVFFYSGHGYPGGFNAYDGRLTYQEIRKAMSKSRAKSKMIFADACFSGKIRVDSEASQAAISSAKKANVMLFLSSRGNETSIEMPSMTNGFFTTYLQRGLRGGADTNHDRIITAKELFDFVHSGVINISNGRQHPVMWGNFPDTMPVMNWN